MGFTGGAGCDAEPTAPSEQKAELEPGGQKELHCPGGPASHSAVASRGVPMAPLGGFLAVKVAPPYPPHVWCAPDTGLRSFVSGAHARPRGGSEGGGPVDVKASSLPSLLRWISIHAHLQTHKKQYENVLINLQPHENLKKLAETEAKHLQKQLKKTASFSVKGKKQLQRKSGVVLLNETLVAGT